MAIRIYHDSEGNEEITSGNPDIHKDAVPENEESETIQEIFLLTDDNELTYENVEISLQGSTSGAEFDNIYVDYNETDDFSGIDPGSQETLSLSDGDYSTAVSVYRRVTVTNVQDPFIDEELYHRVQRDDYIG